MKNRPPMGGGQRLSPVDALLQQGVSLHQAGRYAEAEACYAKALSIAPKNFDAWQFRGRAAMARGDYATAAQSLSEAVRINPKSAPTWDMVGQALGECGQHQQALAAYDQALALQPRFAEALCHRANALLDLGQAEAALAGYDASLAIKSDSAEAHCNRGNALQELGRLQEALAAYERAIALDGTKADAFFNRGSILQRTGRQREAVACYDRTLALYPQHVQALLNRGSALQELERYTEALASYDRAIQIAPAYASAHFNRGSALEKLHRPQDAVTAYERAIALDPNSAETYNNCGNALRALRRADEAIPLYDRALALKPDYVDAITNRSTAFFELKRYDEALTGFAAALRLRPDFPEALYNRGSLYMERQDYVPAVDDFQGVLRTEPDHDFARGNLLHCRMHCCDWRGYDGERNLVEETLRAGKKVVTPFPFQAISSSPADLRKCSEIFVADSYPAKMPVWKGERYTHDKIRIGYVGDSFREQATSYLTVGMFEHHDKSRFEIYAFDNGGGDGGTMRRRLEAAFDRFVDIGPLPDADAAAAIRRCEIDILVNLNGYFGKDRTGVFALRPAPLQVNYLGFPATLGASYFDYIVADEIVIPREHEPFYVEKISWLPECYQSNDDKRPIAAVPPTRAQAGLPDDAFVFCCFNNSYKFTPATFDTWMRILGQVPNSVLWILESNKALAPNLKHEAEARGVSGDRIVFAPFVKPEEHLARQRLADLFLDSLPYNAHTTAADALWGGLPLLTCTGSAFPGRVATSLLTALHLPELITRSTEEFEKTAITLAQDKSRLAAIRAKLAENRTRAPLFNTARFTRHIESAYEMMCALARAGTPQSFAVPPLS